MDLVLSTYLWVSPAILFKRYPHKWGQLDSDFSPQSLCPLCGKLYSLLFSSFFLSVFLSFSLSVSPFPIALLSTRLGAPCTPDNAAPLSYTPAPLLVSLSLSSGWLFPSCQVVCLCVFLPRVRSSCLCRGHALPQNACINCNWAVCSGPGACWDSCLSSPLVFYKLYFRAI